MNKRIYFVIISIALIFVSWIFYNLDKTDYSARQNEHRRKLGAVYMTLNNPFYQNALKSPLL